MEYLINKAMIVSMGTVSLWLAIDLYKKKWVLASSLFFMLFISVVMMMAGLIIFGIVYY